MLNYGLWSQFSAWCMLKSHMNGTLICVRDHSRSYTINGHLMAWCKSEQRLSIEPHTTSDQYDKSYLHLFIWVWHCPIAGVKNSMCEVVAADRSHCHDNYLWCRCIYSLLTHWLTDSLTLNNISLDSLSMYGQHQIINHFN